MVTSGKIPELKIVRNQKQKGSYFGPFIDKNSARKVYDFLIKTFRLKLCKKKIPNGCLFYHLGICAGACKPDFNLPEYLERLELAKLALKNNHKEFTEYISRQMAMHNKKMEFEQSKKLNEYRHAFQNIFTMIDAKTTKNASLDYKDIWYLTEDKNILFLFKEQNSILTKKDIFYMPISENFLSYFEGYYHQNSAPAIVLINFELPEDTRKLYQNFLGQWHHKTQPITLMLPKEGHFADLIKLAKIHAEMEQEKQGSVAKALKTLLRLPKEPHSIDCFDISHKQGKFMVGSCVRFIDGKPDKSNLRHFHIKTLDQQNDCAALAEIVTRRYKDKEVPDLILIDGGKGQLNAVLKYMPDAEFASLAKREEIIYTKRLLKGRKLNIKTFAGQLLIALRDYAHHFAISFHRNIEKLS